MNRLIRPSILVVISTGLALWAAGVIFWPQNTSYRASPLSVPPGDQEIVWLYPATNAAAWERFVTAAQNFIKQNKEYADLKFDDANAFPEQSTSVPEISIGTANFSGRLRIRWYKRTSDQKTADWVHDLLARTPPPLAIIGGEASDEGINLAKLLRDETGRQSAERPAPLLLLTGATADDAGPNQGPLNSIYPGRTFRFCFTNSHIAEIVTDFIWSREDLRPDSAPVYVTYWEDDPYSIDLNERFCSALPAPFRAVTPESAHISYSVGTYSDPNRWEDEEAGRLMDSKLEQHAEQKRPLLILPADTEPTRRFLRALVRSAPVEARHFVVATGDSLAFNTIYRDRNMAWPIQDLPFKLVLFFHDNPIAWDSSEANSATEGTAPGTEDLLLFGHVVRAILAGCFTHTAKELPRDSSTLAALWRDFFDANGNRLLGDGEHVVYLEPRVRGKQVLPEATIHVWRWLAEANANKMHWEERAALKVHYEGYAPQE